MTQLFLRNFSNMLTREGQIPQNGQTLKQFDGKLQTNCLSMFQHFVGLALKRLIGRSKLSV